MPPPAVTDSSKAEIFGSKIPNRNNQNVVISMLKPPQIDYSNGEESDSNSDDGTVYHVDDEPIELTGYENNFTTATMKFAKQPLRQTMSTASSTSTSSNESYNLNTDNPNLWIGSSTSSESECEYNSKEIEQKQKESEDEIRKGLENFHIVENNNSVKNSELKIMNTTLDNVDNLSLQTSKMNINFSINDEKSSIGEERKFSVNNYNSQNDEEYLTESEDSDSSDDQTESASENEVWKTRGKWPKNHSTENTSNVKNGTDFVRGFRKTPNNQTTMNLPPESWRSSGTGQCQNIGNYCMMNQYQLAYSSPTRPEYMNVQSSWPASTYSPISFNESSHGSEGYHSLSNGGCEDIFRRSSPSFTNVQSTYNTFNNFENPREFKNLENSYSITKMNLNEVPKRIENYMTSNIVASDPKFKNNFEFEDIIPIDDEKKIGGMDPPLSSASLVQLNIPLHNVSQTNSMKMAEQRHDFEQTDIIDDVIAMELERLEKQNNSNRANSAVSSNKNMLFQAQYLACTLKTPELNQLNSDNLNAIRIPPTITAAHDQDKNNSNIISIYGSSDTGGLVTVNQFDDREEKIRQIMLDLESVGDRKQILNGIQAPTIRENYHKDEQNCNFRPNIGLESIENPKGLNTLIPLPVDERSQTVVDKKLKKIQNWAILDLPDTNACQRLKKMLDVREVEKFERTYIQFGEEYFGPNEKTGNTFLMVIVRNPRVLLKNINCLMPMVGRMLHDSKSLMTKNNQGHDALYLAAINCPELSYVTGYLAAIIEKFSKKYDLKLNTYNQTNDTLMHAVAAQGDSHLSVMKELLTLRDKRGRSFFDPSAQNSEGKTPLHLAVEANSSITSKQSLKMVQLLMENGADICVQENKEGNTALHTAIAHARSKSMAQILLRLGRECAAVNIKNNKGNLPIHLAAACLNSSSLETQADVCRYLVDNKSPTNVPNYDNKMPLALVAPERKKLIEKIFRKKC